MRRASEDQLIARYFAPFAGPGALGLVDDAGLATPRPGCDLVVTKDVLVAGVHFFADDPPGAIARKALRVNLSDLAAKAAVPFGFLLGLALPPDWTEAWLASFADGLAADARTFACPLIGGDTVATPGPLTLSVSAFGEVPRGAMVRRTSASEGDRIYVTGTIGDAALGLRLRLGEPVDKPWIAALDESAVAALRARYLLPEPRLGLRGALAQARAAMDVSDGLIGDLSRMLHPGGLTAALEAARLPLSPAVAAAVALEPRLIETALTGGDDYEILCAVPPDRAVAFETAARQAGVRVTAFGQTVVGHGAPSVRDGSGAVMALKTTRFDHFE